MLPVCPIVCVSLPLSVSLLARSLARSLSLSLSFSPCLYLPLSLPLSFLPVRSRSRGWTGSFVTKTSRLHEHQWPPVGWVGLRRLPRGHQNFAGMAAEQVGKAAQPASHQWLACGDHHEHLQPRFTSSIMVAGGAVHWGMRGDASAGHRVKWPAQRKAPDHAHGLGLVSSSMGQEHCASMMKGDRSTNEHHGFKQAS